MTSAWYFLLLKSTDSWSLLHSRRRFSRSNRFDLRGKTEENFEEGAKSEVFHSDTNSRQRHLNLASYLQRGGQFLPPLIIFIELASADRFDYPSHSLPALPVCYGSVQTSVWNRWNRKGCLIWLSWEFDDSVRHFLDTHTVLICECWKEDLTSARLTSLDRGWRTWFWIVPPDLILLLMCCTVNDCNFPWPPPCRTRLLDSLVASSLDGNLRFNLGMIMCLG